MFEYDNFYNVLFLNNDFLEILDNFRGDIWSKLGIKEKKVIINSFVDKYCELLQIKRIDVVFNEKEKGNVAGSYLDTLQQLSMYKKVLSESISGYSVLFILYHELRHNYQYRSVVGNVSDIETVSDENVKEWKTNFLQTSSKNTNYIPQTYDFNMYVLQPVEVDAYKQGFSLVKHSYNLLKDKFGNDDSFYKYCEDYKHIILLCYSDDNKYTEIRDKNLEKIRLFYENNMKMFDIDNKCFSIAENLMKKEIKDLNEEDILALFSSHVWERLDFNYKYDVLVRFCDINGEYGKIPITRVGSNSVNINDFVGCMDYIDHIVNIAYSLKFEYYVDAILEGKVQCDDELKEQLKINMYKHNGKMINFIDSERFLFEYSLQPFAILESKLLKKWFVNAKEIINRAYGIEDQRFDEFINHYSYLEIQKMANDVYGKSFEDVCDDVFNVMKDRVNKVSFKRM